MAIKNSVRVSVAFLLVATCFVVMKPSGVGAWTLTSPQVSVSVFRGAQSGIDRAYSVALDSSANVYTTGRFAGTVDFDPGSSVANLTSTPYQDSDAFVSKLDASGNYVWAKRFGGPSASGNSIAVDSSGNVYTIGSFYGTGDFDPNEGVANLASVGMEDVFVSKLDALGNYVWAKSFGGNLTDDGSEA